MTITQQPSALNLSGNLPDILLSDVTLPVSFVLSRGASLLLSEMYYPDTAGKVRIRLSDLIHQHLHAVVPDFTQTVYHQDTAYADYTATVNSEPPINFRVVKGFLQRGDFDVNQFLSYNWMTTQPTSKTVKFHDPEWLTCYPLEPVDVKIRATFPDGTNATVTYATLETNKVQSVQLNPGIIIGLFATEPLHWDIYTESAGQLRHYAQRYRYSEQCDAHDDVFVFENRLGGVDSIRFVGVKVDDNSAQFENARFDELVFDYFAEAELAMQKNTGLLATTVARSHALDFLRSVRKHHLNRGFITSIYLTEKPSTDIIDGQLNSFTFTYAYSDFKVAYPEIATPPALIELPE